MIKLRVKGKVLEQAKQVEWSLSVIITVSADEKKDSSPLSIKVDSID